MVKEDIIEKIDDEDIETVETTEATEEVLDYLTEEKNVIELFKQIQSINSLNTKKKLISENKGNHLFTRYLQFLLSPNVVTGINSNKLNKNVNVNNSSHKLNKDSNFWEVISYLEKHNTGKDEDIQNIQNFLNGHEENRTFYEQMITKTFRLGADAKLVNSCIPGLIPTFNVMLGTSIDKIKLKGNEEIFISRKLNGCRCVYMNGKLISRQGKEFAGLNHIINDINKLDAERWVIDGELLYKNIEGLTDSEAFQKGTGIAMSKTMDKTELKYVIFDTLPIDEFINGKSKDNYSTRKYYLDKYKRLINENNLQNLEIVPFLYEGKDHSKIWQALDYAESNDWEGVMINLDTPYECKRTKNLIKVKKFFTVDIRCTDIEEGSGKNKGTLGAIVCDYKGNKVNVGSGFSDEQRHQYWAHPEEILNHIVTVKFKEETKNKDGGISIQFPIFESVRFDKAEPSYD